MAVRQEGEFELVLGNRQLFSVLGIVVILLGIFFAMGFFAGKSVGQAAANAAAPRRAADQNPLVVDSPQTTPPAPTQASPGTAGAEASAPQGADSSSASAEKPAEREKKGAATAGNAEPPPSKSTAKGSDQVVEPAPGSYLQVAATRLSEAQSLAALLRRHQFHVVLAASTKPELIRVLVGPFASTEATTEARAKLKNLDIAKPYPVKY